MKRYMLSILPLFLTLCLMAGCGGRSGMHSRLAAVDSIVDSRYDSALTVLRGMDTLQMRRSDRMYLELLRAKAMNKASVPFTSDSVMRRVARYYDRHGSPNQRLQAHYLLGCVYRDLRSAPRALEEYQQAASQADTTRADCDLPTLMRVHSQMSNLYMMMRMRDKSLQATRDAQTVCYLMGDSLTALLFEENFCSALCDDGKYRECIEATQKLYDHYAERRMEDDGALVCIYFARAYNGLGDFPQARHYLDMYERCSYLRTDPRKVAGGLAPYHICRGNCFLGLGMPDSAEVCFRKATEDMYIMHDEDLVYNGLLHTYMIKRETDSICKYARLANEYIIQDFNVSTAEDAIQVKSIYDYEIERQIAEEKSRRLQRLSFLFAFSLLITGLIYAFAMWFNEKKKRRIGELNVMIAQATDKLRLAEEELVAATEEKDENQERIRESELAIKKQEEIITQLTGELNKIAAKTTSRDLSNTPIVIDLQRIVDTPAGENLSPSQWLELKTTVEEMFPTFYQEMNGREQLSVTEYRVCLLVKAGFSPSSIDTLMDYKPKYASCVRKRLHKKVFGTEGSSTDFDSKVRNIGEEPPPC